MDKQPNSRMCFVCGIENPIGLELQFYSDKEGRCIARFQPKPEHQGYPGHLHGGLIGTLLDETIGRALLRDGYWAVTGRSEVRFRKPVPIGKPVQVIGEVTHATSRAVEGHGKVLLADGTVAAEADVHYVRLPDGQVSEMKNSLGFWEVVQEEA